VKVLITGGAGFVGRYFTNTLLNLGNDVTVVDSIVAGTGAVDPTKSPWYVGNPHDFAGFKFVNQDCRDFFKSNSASSFELIIHLAAIVGGRLVIERNPMAVAEDLEIDSSFWRWVTTASQAHVISFSSSAAYPISLQRLESHRPLVESDIDFRVSIGIPDLSYGWAKLTSEYLGVFCHQKHGIKIANYRPFSGYGPDQDLSYPFPSIMKRVYEHKTSDEGLHVWGSGMQERDFIHIQDVVDNVLSTYKNLQDGSSLNLGTGTGTNLLRLAAIALETLGKDCVVSGMSNMPEGVFSRVADINLSHNTYKMNNKIDLREGIRQGLSFWN